MSDKLLGKPPFRFLHDTITAITAATGFAQGLYDDDMLDNANIKDKGSKIAYLETIFNMVGICKGHPLDVRAQKVVAGLEPANTCAFLIALGECARDSGVDSDAAVRRTRGGEMPGDGPPARVGVGAPAESKDGSDSPGAGAKGDGAKADMKGFDDDQPPVASGPPEGFGVDSAVAQERGKSRSGTRGSKPNQTSAGAAGAGLMGIGGGTDSMRPADLDTHVERCDGVVATTQDLLGGLITRPKLTEKLLGKPPFRFLHDVLMEVTRATGFGKYLYNSEESDSKAVTSKEAKINFLEKMIKVVGVQLNTIVEARPAKIVAGLEPQNTNVFLQLLAVAASKMPDSYESVKTVLEQNGESMPVDAVPGGGAGIMADAAAAQQQREVFSPSAEAKRSDRSPQHDSPDKRQEIGPAGGDSKGGDDNSGGGGSDEPRSMRPTTARRRPPKIKDGARELTAKETAPAQKKTAGILRDGEGDEDDDDDENLMADQKRLGGMGGSATPAKGDEAAPESKLVKDILSRQAEQEAADAPLDAKVDTPTEEKPEETKAQGSGIRIGARLRSKKKGGAGSTGTGAAASIASGSGSSGGGTMSPQDVERLRAAIQVLVQQTGPLGTCMDYIQEDVGQMSAELHKWEEDCRKYERTLDAEKERSDEVLRPLQLELKDLESQVEEVIKPLSQP